MPIYPPQNVLACLHLPQVSTSPACRPATWLNIYMLVTLMLMLLEPVYYLLVGHLLEDLVLAVEMVLKQSAAFLTCCICIAS